MIHCAALWGADNICFYANALERKKGRNEGRKKEKERKDKKEKMVKKTKQLWIPYIHKDWAEQRKMLTWGLWKVNLYNPKMVLIIGNTEIYFLFNVICQKFKNS